MELQHFSHEEHPLKFIENYEGRDQCDLCYITIFDSAAYSCNECKNYVLHKLCAEAPKEIQHPSHSQHSLTLTSTDDLDYDEYANCLCHFCRDDSWPGFAYSCSLCRFMIHLPCTLDERLIKHVGHMHPLIRIDQVRYYVEGEEEVLCDGCREPILGSSAYMCSTNCVFFLHEKCFELPKEINHPMHKEHPLLLLTEPPYDRQSGECSVCRNSDGYGFTYHCSICKFDIDVKCAFKESVVFEHEGHHHPLTVNPRPASFYCDACGVTDEDNMSYKCTTCPFWIHKTCGSSANTIERGDHKHPLVLSYSLPYTHRAFEQFCYICHENIYPIDWVYYCAGCRYFLHLKCSRTEPASPSSDSDSVAESEIGLLLPGDLTDLISRLVEINSEDNEAEAQELMHFNHDHPLTIFDSQRTNEMENGEVLICNGCVRPIVIPPFYGCEQCSFFLHKSCAELPQELQHQSHPQHSLHLIMTNKLLISFVCESCNMLCNGLAFWCEYCNFYLDVRCASTFSSATVKHGGHKHALQFKCKASKDQCGACGNVTKYGEDKHPIFVLECAKCGYYLDNYCAMLPRTIKQEWEHHPLNLIYPPFYDHPDEFLCEFCEEFIDPNYWLYHCRICDHSFHARCLQPVDKYLNIKFGGTLRVESHPHHLTFVQKSKYKSPIHCDHCGEVMEGSPVHECESCCFQLCTQCARRNVECASQPVTVKHRGHNHPLQLQSQPSNSQCNICHQKIVAFEYKCEEDMCEFHLHNHCALLPQTITHTAYREHLLSLTPLIFISSGSYPIFLKCTSCEGGISICLEGYSYPGEWYYSSSDHGDTYYHLKCISVADYYSNFMFGSRLQDENHPHALKFVPNSKNKPSSPCDQCGECEDGYKVLECETCNFRLCLRCAQKNSIGTTESIW